MLNHRTAQTKKQSTQDRNFAKFFQIDIYPEDSSPKSFKSSRRFELSPKKIFYMTKKVKKASSNHLHSS